MSDTGRDTVRDTVQDHASRLARAERRWLLDARARLRSTATARPTPATTTPEQTEESR